MANYNIQLQSNNTDLQTVLQTLQNKATGGGGNSGDGYDEADSLITMDMSTYTNNRVTTVGQGAFAYASKLQSVSFSAATNVGSYAFYNCSSLTTVNFPVAMSIGNSAFESCRSLITASFPAATTIGSDAF